MSEIQNLRVASRRRELKKQAVAYKGGKCVHCGYDKSIAAMEFHHVDPSKKDFQISTGRTRSWDRVKSEIDKCVLLCSNCHKEEHEKLFSERRIRHEARIAEMKRKRAEMVNVPCSFCNKVVLVTKKRIERYSFHCSTKCGHKDNEKTQWPTDSRLMKMVWKVPMTTLAKRLGVSDKAIKKRCRSRGIETPYPGYWMQRSNSV